MPLWCCTAAASWRPGDVATVIEAAEQHDMRSAFIALTGGAKEEPE